MNKNTKEFVGLLFEQTKLSAEEYIVTTSNQISKGRPISDPGLTDIKSRAEQSTGEAVELLKDLGVSKPSGSDWPEEISALFNSAKNTKLGALLQGAKVIKNKEEKPGVVIVLNSLWSQDDKGGKRSYGYLRSLIIAAAKAGWVNMDTTSSRIMRLEMVDGKDQAILYISKKAQSWA
tara:strand:+ start:48538 stop:49068 length:531 start_codon:yes stop_codon:yes gene_type:complete